MNFKLNKLILLIHLIGFLSINLARSQNPGQDSLSLNVVISEVVQNHPMVKKAMEDVNASDAKIGVAKSAYLPYVDFESSYSRIGPISSIAIPGMGSFILFPHDNYTGGFNINQTLFDFGKTDKNVSIEKEGREISRQTVEQVKQKLSQAVISTYFSLLYLQEAMKIKNEQINTLQEHLAFVNKKKETGSATQYEILTTQVRISNTENQKTDIETARQVQVSQINSLLGKPQNIDERVKLDLSAPLSEMPYDSLFSIAMQKRDEMKLAAEKARLAQLHYDFISKQNNPLVNAFFSGGVKNGYIPDLNEPRINFAAGVGLKIPIFDGKRNKYNLIQAKSVILSSDDDTEITRRNIISEIIENEANVKASQQKVEQSQLQFKQASDAYTLAKVRYEAGVITNLELLDGSTALSESSLMLLKAEIDHTMNLFRLKYTIGEKLY